MSLYCRYLLYMVKGIISHNLWFWKSIFSRSVTSSHGQSTCEHGNGGTIFVFLATRVHSVGVLNGGETQLEGVWIWTSWEERTNQQWITIFLKKRKKLTCNYYNTASNLHLFICIMLLYWHRKVSMPLYLVRHCNGWTHTTALCWYITTNAVFFMLTWMSLQQQKAVINLCQIQIQRPQCSSWIAPVFSCLNRRLLKIILFFKWMQLFQHFMSELLLRTKHWDQGLTHTCVFHLVVVHHGQGLHGIIDRLPL